MLKLNSVANKIEKFKPYIWACFLSSVVAKYAIGNIILIIMGLCFIFQLIAYKGLKFRKVFIPLLLYFLFGTFSLIWTTNLAETSAGISRGIYLLLIPILMSQYEKFTLLELGKTLRLSGIILLVYFLISLINSGIQFLEDGIISHFFYHELTAVFSNNAIYISLFTSGVFLILFNLKNKKNIDNYICLGLLLYLLLLSSKILIITTLFIQACLTFRSIRSNLSIKKVVYFTSIPFLILLLISLIDNPLKERFMDLSLTGVNEIWKNNDFLGESFNGITIRLFQWRIVFEMFLSGNVGILGLGWNNIDYLSSQYFSYYNFYRGYFNINFHNQYLQTLGELGIIGLSILIFTILKSIQIGYKQNIYLLIFSILIAISFLTESLLSRQKGLIIFTVFYCLLYHLKTKKNIKFN